MCIPAAGPCPGFQVTGLGGGTLATPLREKLGAVVLGTFLTVLLLELALWAVGALGSPGRAGDVPTGGRTLLCLGDSYTYGAGVPEQDAWPAQLQVLLDQDSPGTWTVVNLGANGENTTALLAKAGPALERYQPAAVVLLTGGANLWDQAGYRAFLEDSSVRSRILDRLQRVRVVRLVRLALLRPQQAPTLPAPAAPGPASDQEGTDLACEGDFRGPQREAATLMEQRRHGEAVEMLAAVAPQAAGCWRFQDLWGLALMEEERFEEAAVAFRRATELMPTSAKAWDHLGQAERVLGRRDGAVEALVRGLATPQSAANQYEKARILSHLAGMVDLFGAETRSYTEQVLDRVGQEHPELGAWRAEYDRYFSEKGGISDWIRHDIEAVLDLCAARGIPVVFMSYPLPMPGALVGLLEDIAVSRGLPFVDNQSRFAARPDRASLFLPDGHCSRAGNGVVALGVREALARVSRGPGPPPPSPSPDR